MLSEELKIKLDKYCRALEEEMIKRYPTSECVHYKYTYNLGKKYIKIVQCDHTGQRQQSVFCFVDYAGNLYKASSWNAPAKDIRGHIDNPIINGYGFYKRY